MAVTVSGRSFKWEDTWLWSHSISNSLLIWVIYYRVLTVDGGSNPPRPSLFVIIIKVSSQNHFAVAPKGVTDFLAESSNREDRLALHALLIQTQRN